MPTTEEVTSPRWGGSTKLIVALTAVALIAWVLWRFQFLIAPLVTAVMIAYLLNPVITFIAGRLKWSRTGVAALLYLILVLALASLATGVGLYVANQIAGLNLNVQQIVADLPKRIDELTHSQFVILGYTIDLSRLDFTTVYNQIASAIQLVLTQTGSIVGQVASNTAEFVGWTVLVLLVSFYIVKDVSGVRGAIDRYAADPGYQRDASRLIHEFQNVWNAFLRGQAALAITIWLVDWIGLSILNVRYAFVLGLLAGLLEFVPTIGPITAGAIGIGIALFQPGNWFGLSPLPYAAVVALFFFLVQQAENYVLVPRIIGEHLNLHPALIMIGAIMGASLAGILGLLLAAPMAATIKLFGRYAWRKMLDLPPFEEEEAPKPKPIIALPKIDFKAWFKRGEARKKTTDKADGTD
ncbi:MAG: AI-2E family transporter [Chloroflexi bacterium]|nr:AI-2E family transporter [Chloroflexota bacterium]